MKVRFNRTGAERREVLRVWKYFAVGHQLKSRVTRVDPFGEDSIGHQEYPIHPGRVGFKRSQGISQLIIVPESTGSCNERIT